MAHRLTYKDKAYLKLFDAVREIENAIRTLERLEPNYHPADLYSRYLHLQNTIIEKHGVLVHFTPHPAKKP